MPELLTRSDWSHLIGRVCILTSSNGTMLAGRYMGLSSLGTKDFARFTSTSGEEMLVNVSYLATLEVLNEDQAADDYRGQAGGVAYVGKA